VPGDNDRGQPKSSGTYDARRLAQRGVPIAALLRAYRIGLACFEDWCLQELGRQTDNASLISAAGMRITGDNAVAAPGSER